MAEPLKPSVDNLHVTHEFANEPDVFSNEESDVRSRLAETQQPSSFQQMESPVPENSPAMTEDFRPAVAVTSDFQPAQAEASASEEAEESIDDYMARLLNRVNNGVDAAIAVGSTTPPANPKKAEKPEKPKKSPEKPAVSEGEADENLIVEVRLPKRAPEDRDGLMNMRRLANATAHNALRTHNCRQLASRLYAMLALIVGALTISCVFAIISPGVFSFRFGVALLSMLFGTFGIWRYSTMVKQLLASSQAVASIPEAEVVEPAS